MRIAVCCPLTDQFKTQQSLKALPPHGRAWAVLSKLDVDPRRKRTDDADRTAAVRKPGRAGMRRTSDVLCRAVVWARPAADTHGGKWDRYTLAEENSGRHQLMGCGPISSYLLTDDKNSSRRMLAMATTP